MIDGLREPRSPAMSFGIDGHAVIEDYLKHGVIPEKDDIGTLVHKAIDKGFLPDAVPGLLVEKQFNLPIGQSSDVLLGYIDCLVPGEVPLVVDHKFTKSFNWMKTEEELLTNVQAVMYSHAALELIPEAKEVGNRWIYYAASGNERPRKPVGVRVTELLRTRADVKMLMKPIMERVHDMLKLRRSKHPANEILPDLNGCGAYGGCPFKTECFGKSSFKKTFKAMLKQAIRSPKQEGKELKLIDKLKKRQQEAGATGVNPEEEKETPKSGAAARLAALKAKNKEKTEEKPEEKSEKEKPKASSAAEKLAALKAKNKGKTEEKTEAKVEEKTEAKPAEKKAEKKKRTRKKITANQFMVLINASVSKLSNGFEGSQPTQLSELLLPIMQQVANDAGEAHWALIEYGKGKAYLACAFDKWLEENDWKGMLVVDNASPEAQAVREVLIARADLVIRGNV
jgi:hypothetical protein